MRQWLTTVEKLGELERIAGAHWNVEIGCLAAMNHKRKNAPALLFEQVPGYPPDYRVLTSSTSTVDRVAMTLGLPRGMHELEVVAMLREKLVHWEESLDKYSPDEVNAGHATENVVSGKDVDLLKFPVPKWHEEDGGRYIGTADAVITRNMDTGKINIGTYRVMVHDKNTTGIYVCPGRHGDLDVKSYHARGKPCPILVSVGHHPLVFRIACREVPAGAEYQYIGAIQGEPMKVIKEEITGLPFPADSEIVIAGWCPPGKTRSEGPFGEWPGYYASKETDVPVIEVERVYHRHGPIILGSPPGRPPNEDSYYLLLTGSAMLHNHLVKAGIPDIRGVWLSEAGLRQFITISIRQRYAGHAKQAAILASQLPPVSTMNRYIVVVDEDIDPTDIQDVMWAICTRSNPVEDIDIIRNVRTTFVDPTVRRPGGALITSRAIIDACKPFEWKDDYARAIGFDPRLQASMRRRYPRFTDKRG